jgi:hypothetical protein
MTGSKPNLVGALTKTWRTSAEHLSAQVWRFVRLTALSAVPSVFSLVVGGKFDWRTLLAFIAPFAEVAYRQVVPALTAQAADSAPGVTIVPEQLALPTLPDGTTGNVTVTTPEGDAAP